MKLELCNKQYTIKKGNYANGRIALLLFDEQDILYDQLTVNLPEAMLMCEANGESPFNVSFINHIDGLSYDYLLNELENQNLIENNVGNAKSGFNNYIAFTFNEDKMKTIQYVHES